MYFQLVRNQKSRHCKLSCLLNVIKGFFLLKKDILLSSSKKLLQKILKIGL